MRRVHVSLGERSYDIRIGGGLIQRIGAECHKLGLGRRCAIVTDSNIPAWAVKTTTRSLKAAGFEVLTITLVAGEKSKNLSNVEKVFNQLASHRLERKSFLIALGGGVVGDLTGYAAASYLRGIDFVQVPTTLLAQVDSSVGGKTGVNLKAGKNLVGAFHQPRLVLCDTDILKDLPDREYRSGIAEIIKYGIIYDARLFSRLEKDMNLLIAKDPKVISYVVARSCEIKAAVVAEDEKEGGLRAILNFGHTIGHAIEAVSKYGKYLHGEAISIGQVAAARLSEEVLSLPRKDSERIRALFEATGLPVSMRMSKAVQERILAATRLDKKVSGGVVKFVLAEKIGKVRFGLKVEESLVHAELERIGS